MSAEQAKEYGLVDEVLGTPVGSGAAKANDASIAKGKASKDGASK
jgi:hypothetical protein